MCIHVCVFMCMCVYTCTCMCVHACVCTHVVIWTYQSPEHTWSCSNNSRSPVHTHTDARTHKTIQLFEPPHRLGTHSPQQQSIRHTHALKHTHTHTHAHTHTRAHTHTHTTPRSVVHQSQFTKASFIVVMKHLCA